jgi:2-oxoglutarate dehydrogenase E1 component
MYAAIKKHPDPLKIYAAELDKKGIVPAAESEKLADAFYDSLNDRYDLIQAGQYGDFPQVTEPAWAKMRKSVALSDEDMVTSPTTGLSRAEFDQLLDGLNNPPASVKLQKRMMDLLKRYKEEVANGNMQWAQGEMLSYAHLLTQGQTLRITGQDVQRATFSHRLAVVIDENNPQHKFNRLAPFTTESARAYVHNSFLSEYAVLGFEYGYSLADPNTLTIWEAQFGDFANGAQIVIDQFIMSAESKWLQQSGLVLLLPHGFEDQGPEHSSARLERFLQMCAENNVTVANISTPANLFHAFRRQTARDFRKPLIVMSPKSLFKRATCVSAAEDFLGDTRFLEVIDDAGHASGKGVERVLYCSGKVYYDLLDARAAAGLEKKVALVRIEQLYPLPVEQLKAVRSRYPAKAMHCWVQEEPANAGAADFIDSRRYRADFAIDAFYCRKDSASPACGSDKRSAKEREALMNEALGIS